jgi:hypothetical protein
MDKPLINLVKRKYGWGAWIRTKTGRVRVCSATVTPRPNGSFD